MKDNSRFGEVVYIRYRGGIEDGDIIDERIKGEPLRIILGGGHVIPGIEDALCKMHIGDERNLIIAPEDAYGRYQEDAVQTYPRTAFPFGDELAVGETIQWTNPASGMPVPVRVVEATKDTISLDFNHLLAGQTLSYWVKVVDKEG